MWGSLILLVYAGIIAFRNKSYPINAALVLAGATLSLVCYLAIWFGYPRFVSPAEEAGIALQQTLLGVRQVLLPLGHFMVAIGVVGLVRAKAI